MRVVDWRVGVHVRTWDGANAKDNERVWRERRSDTLYYYYIYVAPLQLSLK